MTPVDYMNNVKSGARNVPPFAKQVFDSGCDLIGERMTEEGCRDVSPQDVKVITVLVGFIHVFIDHATSIETVRELAEGQLEGAS